MKRIIVITLEHSDESLLKIAVDRIRDEFTVATINFHNDLFRTASSIEVYDERRRKVAGAA